MAQFTVDKKSVTPAYFQIQSIVEELIEQGEFGPGSQLPSALDLAKRFEVSPMTIRQALTPLVQKGFLERRQGSGTFVATSEQLASRRKVHLGVVCTGFHHQEVFWGEVFRGLEQASQIHSCDLHFHLTPSGTIYSNYLLNELVQHDKLSGLLVLGSLTQADMDQLRELKVPLILLDCHDSANADMPRVLLDDHAAMDIMVSHLVQQGHQRIALVAGQASQPSSTIQRRSDRMIKGYQTALRKKEIQWETSLICQTLPNELEKDGIQRELAKWMAMDKPPTAIIAHGDRAAWNLFNWLSKKKISVVNEHIVIANYADSADSCFALVHKPLVEMSEQAVSYLMQVITGKIKKKASRKPLAYLPPVMVKS